ncbi:MAG: hypothetical protein SFY68_14135, partial [Candidatus Sumerlaeia bacterium]|nr:hypothetical protein [Candidatus Sumerlaeia bacterium]
MFLLPRFAKLLTPCLCGMLSAGIAHGQTPCEEQPNSPKVDIPAVNKTLRNYLVSGGGFYQLNVHYDINKSLFEVIKGYEAIAQSNEDFAPGFNFQQSGCEILQTLKLDSIKGVGKSLSKLPNGDSEFRTVALLDKQGVFSVYDTQPFNTELLTYVPGSADFVMVINLNTTQVLPLLDSLFLSLNSLPESPKSFDDFLTQLEIERSDVQTVSDVLGKPIVIWFEGWDQVEKSPEGKYVFTPTPKFGVVLTQAPKAELLTPAFDEVKITDERFSEAYSLALNPDPRFPELTMTRGTLKNGSYFLRIQETKEALVVQEAKPFDLAPYVSDVSTVHSFVVQNAGLDHSYSSLKTLWNAGGEEEQQLAMGLGIMRLAVGPYYTKSGFITSRHNIPEGTIWRTISPEITPSAGLGSTFLPAYIGIVTGIAIPAFVKAQETSRSNACQFNQLVLQDAAYTYAFDQSIEDYSQLPFIGKTVDSEEAKVLFGDSEASTCPSGGTYTFVFNKEENAVMIQCSHDGNSDGILDHPYPGT